MRDEQRPGLDFPLQKLHIVGAGSYFYFFYLQYGDLTAQKPSGEKGAGVSYLPLT